jgi:hypothetical protein
VTETSIAGRLIQNWARYTLQLSAAEQEVLANLADAPAVRQQAQAIFQTTLATDAQRREIALRMALAELQAYLEQA